MFSNTAQACRLLICAASLVQGGILWGKGDLIKDASQEIQKTDVGFSDGIWLRIMPLGASITYGVASHDGNGYRESLRNQIVNYGNHVNMVGSRRNGTMEDNDVEGWPGYIISQVQTVAEDATPKYKPNVVLINVGTNDCTGNIDTGNAGTRMSNLLDAVYSGSPRATVILSTLLLRWEEKQQNCVLDVNKQYRSVAAAQRAKGRRIVLVDMQPPAGPTADELADGTHPTDAGYVKMANIWFRGIQEADDRGYLLTKEAIPGNPDGVPDRGTYN